MKKSITASNLTLDLYLDYVRPAARAAGILEEVPARDDWHEYTAEVTEETAAAEIAHCMYCACMCAGNDGIKRTHEEYIRHEAERMVGQLEVSIKYDLHGCADTLTALLAALREILNPTEREETTPAPTYTYSMSAKAYTVQATGKLLRVERNKLNPISGGNFVSIAYYQTARREIVGVVM